MLAAPLREAATGQPQYERRRPEQTPLYRLVLQHCETFGAQVEHGTATGLPRFVKDEFSAYLDCGILVHGFLRLICDGCAHDTLVAFSCKRQGIFPSYGTRLIAEKLVYLVNTVLPQAPVRQWVLSFPVPLRSLFSVHPELITTVPRVTHRAVNSHLIK